MKYELKKVVSVGEVTSVDENTSRQYVNITAGVVDVPYNMVETTTVAYNFANSMSVADAKAGVEPFAVNWVATTYPNT